MHTKKAFMAASILVGGALALASPAQRSQEESVKLDLKLEEGKSFRYEVIETKPTASTKGHSDPQRPGQPGGDTGRQDRPGDTAPMGSTPQTHVVSYDIRVTEAGEGGATTKLELTKTKRPSLGGIGGGQDSETTGREEKKFIVEVSNEGDIRSIRAADNGDSGDSGKDSDDKKDDKKNDNGNGDDNNGAKQDADSDQQGAIVTGQHADATDKIRDHLCAILGTGLHGREWNVGEVVILGGDSAVTGRPVEAGSGGQRNPGGDDAKMGMGKLDMDVKVTGAALEFQALERRGQSRLARFRVLEGHMGATDREPADRQDRQPGEQPRQPGQQPGQAGQQPEGIQGAGIASFRVGDGLLEEMTYRPRVKLTGSDLPGAGGETGAGGQQGEQDAMDAFMNRPSIMIRRVDQ